MNLYFRAGLPLLSGCWLPLFAQMSISLSPSVSTPQPLGTVVTWSASVSNSQSGTLEYRFRTRYADWRPNSRRDLRNFLPVAVENLGQAALSNSAEFRTVEDYGPNPSYDWSTIDQEGKYEIEVSVKNSDTGDTASQSALFELTPLAVNDSPIITATSHPLVFIYSAPPCLFGGRMGVELQSPEGLLQNTPYKVCNPRYSTNFYLAGMRAGTPYTVQHKIERGAYKVSGPQLTVTTPSISIQPPPVALLTGAQPTTDGILLQSLLQNNSIATDLSGNIVWYGPDNISLLTRPQAGGTFMGIIEDDAKGPSQQYVREFDLAGHTVAETNAARINEQLAVLGMHAINSFHHEARKLPHGGYLVLANSERILTDVQGPGPVDVIGDTILVLDANLQVTWAWDSFDHLDPHRMAVLRETCTYPANLGCAPFFLAITANDWLHGNSLALTPDGNILYSSRHQDWIIKIDYQYGVGSGGVLWRLGQDGDFQIQSSDPSPWFSHQHDANFEGASSTLSLFDDGNTRHAGDSQAHSRGQVLEIDEENRKATLILNADLGAYSYALGSAQVLPDGNYHFDAGAQLAGPGTVLAQSLEVDPDGNIVYGIQFATYEYRSFRMPDLYTEP